MSKNVEIVFFCLAFLSQILLISWFYARRLVHNRRYVLRNFPPSTHPKLYPQPFEYYERKLRNFARLNLAVVAVGLAIIVAILGSLAGAWDGGMFGSAHDQQWNTTVVTPYFMVQIFASLYLEFSLKHSFAMAKAPPPRVRTTELRPRKLFDFVSPTALAIAVLLNVGFIGFVLYYRRFEFPWFTAAGNITVVAVMFVVFLLSVAFALYSARPDPYQTPQDRRNWLKSVVQHTLATCIAVPVLVTIVLLVKYFDPDILEPLLTSLFCQAFAVLTLWPTYVQRVDSVDYEVYRGDADARQASSGAATGVSL
jgi:MFS family permease